jgi:hypothetical protein
MIRDENILLDVHQSIRNEVSDFLYYWKKCVENAAAAPIKWDGTEVAGMSNAKEVQAKMAEQQNWARKRKELIDAGVLDSVHGINRVMIETSGQSIEVPAVPLRAVVEYLNDEVTYGYSEVRWSLSARISRRSGKS